MRFEAYVMPAFLLVTRMFKIPAKRSLAVELASQYTV